MSCRLLKLRLLGVVCAGLLGVCGSGERGTEALGAGAPKGMVEVKTGKQTFLGRVVAQDATQSFVLGQDGRLQQVPLEKGTTIRELGTKFTSWSSSVVRDQLRRELGPKFAVAGTRHYLVAAGNEKKAQQYAAVFEEVYRTFHVYFSARGFKIEEPEFPLVAIVFPDQQAFAKYARAEKVSAGGSLRGYYLNTSNRVALYEDETRARAEDLPFQENSLAWTHGGDQTLGGSVEGGRPPAGIPWMRGEAGDGRSLRQGAVWGAVNADLQDTMIHEATHQVAFNVGLHHRWGTNPKWVVEGLATVFEAPGIRNSSANHGVKTRINRERFVWFGAFQKQRRQPKSLESFLRSDELYQSNTLDGYSQGWAFTFFLIETRPREYSKYLGLVASRDPWKEYTANDRVADFKKAFGNDLLLLEAEFLRFIGSIK